MHSDLEKLVNYGKIDSKTAEKLELLSPDAFCTHKNWGTGRVVAWDRLGLRVTIDFEEKQGHDMAMTFAAKTLTPITVDSFLARRYRNPEELAALGESDPLGLVKLALSDSDGKILVSDLEAQLKGRIIPEGKYKRWWEATKKKMRESPHFTVPARRTEPLELREENFDPTTELVEQFRNERDLGAKLKVIEAIMKEIGAFDEAQDKLVDLVSEISDIARKSIKLRSVPTVELILAREELQNKIKDFQQKEGAITTAEVLTTETEAIPELLKELSVTRLRQVLQSFPEAFGEEWVEQILDFIPSSNLRTIGEIAHYMHESEEIDALIAHLETKLQQHSITSDALAWVCRERKGLASPIFTPILCLSVIRSLETDQLNDEGSVRSANRLRDLVVSDSMLVPDLIAESDMGTIRNFAGRLVSSAAFDELTRKSLMARIIKLYPETQDLVGHHEKQSEEALIVSEASLVERTAAYDKLIKEEIPQNREDIKVARSYGDLRENFEYKAAKDLQRVLMKRQHDWERELKSAVSTDFSNPDTSVVSIGTVVDLEAVNEGKPLSYTILGAWDSDPEKGILSYLSERGKAMLSRKPGDAVELPLGEGKVEHYRIKSIRAWKK